MNPHAATRRINDNPIACRRIAAGLTQTQLASILHVTQVAVSRWESGVIPRKKILINLAELLKCEQRDLI